MMLQYVLALLLAAPLFASGTDVVLAVGKLFSGLAEAAKVRTYHR